jgi:hypothetical protein
VSVVAISQPAVAFELIEILDIDRVEAAEQGHKNSQTNCCFRCRNCKHEEHENLSVNVTEIMRERDKIRVHRQQHQLNRHQDDDDVAPIEKNANDRDRKEDRAEDEVMGQCQHGSLLRA